MLELEQLTYSAEGRALLTNITAHFSATGISAVIGPNGSGKSLTLRAIMGLITPDSGKVSCAYSRPALVLQRPVILRRTVRQNIAHAAAAAPPAHRADIDALLAVANLTALHDQPARTLSGGEQQRLALVRALAGSPDLLLLDEPTASIDPVTSHQIEQIIAQIAEDGCKVVLVTHNLPQARRLAVDVSLILNGELIEQAPTLTFFDAPQHPATQTFLQGERL